MEKQKTVYIVHAMDVEGPMTETLEATFERMQAYGLPAKVSISRQNLELIQRGKLPGIQPDLANMLKRVFNPRSLAYLTDWGQIDQVMAEVTSREFRQAHSSRDGSPYILSWFIYDHHHGFTTNPRFHDVGMHHIFDHHLKKHIRDNPFGDGIYWHYHHPSINGNALESNTCWTNRATHEEIVAMRMIDRNWYFSCFRAGLHLERNDMSYWLEMFFPFDFSARYTRNAVAYAPGGDWDWRGCPDKWGAWHPDWYDYRTEGTMKRYLFRCTDLATYWNFLSKGEVEEAFAQARINGDSVLTYYNHEYRDMRIEIDQGYEVIKEVAANFPGINWKFVTALEAAQRHLKLKPEKPKLTCHQTGNLLRVKCVGKIFGPQPFLAIKEGKHYFRDNFTQESHNEWAYQFRNLNDVRAFAVAANSPSGLYDLKVATLDR